MAMTNTESESSIIKRAIVLLSIAAVGTFFFVTALTYTARSFLSGDPEYQSIERIMNWRSGQWKKIGYNADFWKNLYTLLNTIQKELQSGNRPNVNYSILVEESEFDAEKNKTHAKKYGTNRPGTDLIPINYKFGVKVLPKKQPDAGDQIDAGTGEKKANINSQLKRMRNAMHYISEKVTAFIDNENDEGLTAETNVPHCTYMLKALGLESSSFEELGISWVYIGSETGLYSIYPGNKEHRAENYDPRRRPWWSDATAQDRSELSERIPNYSYDTNTGITPLYKDYSDKLGNGLIRTVWRRIIIDNVLYIIGVDFILLGDKDDFQKTVVSRMNGDFSEKKNATLASSAMVGGILALLPLLSLILILVQKRTELVELLLMSRRYPPHSQHILKCEWQEYATSDQRKIYIENNIENIIFHEKKKETAIGASVERTPLETRTIYTKSKTDIQEERTGHTVTETLQMSVKDGGTYRGVEKWTLHKREVSQGRCRLCGGNVAFSIHPFNKINTIILKHGSSAVPTVKKDVGKKSLNPTNFLMNLVLKNGEIEEGTEFAYDPEMEQEDVRLPKQVSELSDVQKIKKLNTLLNQGRFRFENSVETIHRLYEKSTINATCQTWYLDHLKKHNKIEVLTCGDRIKRIIVASTEQEMKNTIRDNMKLFQDIEKQHTELAFVCLDSIPELTNHREWDFALIDSEIRESSIVSVSSPGTHLDKETISGYLSWRPSDIRFYASIYEVLDTRKITLVDAILLCKLMK